MPSRTVVALVVAAVVGTAVGVGEIVARSTIDSRISAADPSEQPEFTGTSGLVALATRQIPVAVTLDASAVEDLLAPRLAEATRVDLEGVTLADGALGLDITVGPTGRPAIVWVSLSAAGDALSATVLSVEVAGLHVPADLVLGNRTAMTLDQPLGDHCPDLGLDDIAVTAQGVRVAFTLSPDTRDCIPQEDS